MADLEAIVGDVPLGEAVSRKPRKPQSLLSWGGEAGAKPRSFGSLFGRPEPKPESVRERPPPAAAPPAAAPL